MTKLRIVFICSTMMIVVTTKKTTEAVHETKNVPRTANEGVHRKAKHVQKKMTEFQAESVASQGDITSRTKRSDDGGPLAAVVMQQGTQLTSLLATVQSLQTQLNTLVSTKGSTFIRWGRTQCPSGTTTVYSGYAGGGNSLDRGAGANRLCLVSDPVHDDTGALPAHGTLYGAQYYFSGHSTNTDVLCALCHTPLSATFTVPGTNRCPGGSKEQYHGYLSVGNYAHAAASEFLCLDSNPEDRPGSSAGDHCAWFDHTVTVCGSLPCPPYVSGKIVTCVVCSL